MTPKLNGIDHAPVYVANWNDAEEWYQTILGFKRVDAFMPWAVKDGTLTVENPEGSIHLALFESETRHTVASLRNSLRHRQRRHAFHRERLLIPLGATGKDPGRKRPNGEPL